MPTHDEFDDHDDLPRSGRRDYQEPHRGVMILVFGVLALMMCGLFGIAAWLMGRSDLEKMRLGIMDKEGEPMTRVGYILGIVAMIMNMIGLCFATAYFVFIFVLIAGK